jgi:ATP-dependent RNA helicase DOB1
MFNGTFLALAGDPAHLAALVACLIPVERTNDEITLAKTLVEPLAELRAAARNVAEVSIECGLPLDDPEEYVDKFVPTLMDVTYRWAKGASFAEICGLTELFEGSIVRAMRRLDELLGQLGEAAADVGDTGLKDAFAGAQAAIRRGACFCASLYL